MADKRRPEIGRRNFLEAAGTLAAVSLLGTTAAEVSGQTTGSGNVTAANVRSRRRLGSLEVSSIGLGVQNVSRKYETTVPHRPEMINIIRTAFDRGVTFFDTAEAYGPHEAERILGEAMAPFRDKVVITSKFGWNIDQETGERPTQMTHMLQNIGADAVRFTPSELAELNASVSAIQIRGARLPDQVLAFSGVEAPPKK